MEASRRTKYLKALGVVQYRRRSLTVVNTLSVDDANVGTSAAVPHQLIAGNTLAPIEKVKVGSKAADIFNKPAGADDLVQELAQVHADLSQDIQGINKATTDNQNRATFGFDLLVWRTGKVLVLEFSTSEPEEVSLKHRLTNNILKALWPVGFNGVELHQHTWPMQGVTADIVSATEWLNSLVAGHLHHESSMPIWVMGETGLKMLFPDRADSSEHLSELIGTQIHHEKLGVELIISPSLKHISESAVAKAQAWQLLQPIR